MVATNFNKLKVEVDSIESSITEQIKKLKAQIAELDNDVQMLEKKKTEITEKSEQMKAANLEAKNNLDTLTKESEDLNSKLTDRQNLHKSTEEKISDLKHEKRTLETDIGKQELREDELAKSITGLEGDISKIKDELVNAESLYEERVASIEKEVAEVEHTHISLESQYKILKSLLDEEYIKSTYYDVCKSLQKPGVEDFNRLAQVSAVDPNTVKTTLNELSKKDILSYDESSGAFSVLKEFVI